MRPRPAVVLLVCASAAAASAACATSSQSPAPNAPPVAPAPSATAAPPSSSAPVATSPATPEAQGATTIPSFVAEAVAAADRSDADRKLDAGRHPAETLAFFGIRPGWRVAEIGAAGGYTTELLARIVGPNGVVFAHNSQFVIDRFAGKVLGPRLKKPVNAKVVSVVREFDDPLPPEATKLDAVVNVLFYHDTVWMGIDRDKMNRAIFAALKPGGIYGIVDHSARDGAGVSVAKTLHRIEEKVVLEEVERAGFELAAEAEFLRNPDDPRDWNASPKAAGERRGTSDRFVLKFIKP